MQERRQKSAKPSRRPPEAAGAALENKAKPNAKMRKKRKIVSADPAVRIDACPRGAALPSRGGAARPERAAPRGVRVTEAA